MTELLVCISVLAILLMLLQPSLSRIHEQALALKCSKNFNNLGVLMTIFAADHNDYHIGTGRANSGTMRLAAIWDLHLKAYYKSATPVLISSRVNINTVTDYDCPAALDITGRAFMGFNWNMTGYDGRFNYSSGCSVENQKLAPEDYPVGINPNSYTYYLGTNLSRISQPSIFIDAADHTMQTTNYSAKYDYIKGQSSLYDKPFKITWSNYEDAPTADMAMTFRHDKRATVLFLDGHVELAETQDDLNRWSCWRF